MHVDPEGSIDCGACIPARSSDSIHSLDDVPDDKMVFSDANAAYFKN
jgi:NAD-dependent dihydropyrimidine dehydrogenase PreA subunit